MNTIQTLSTDLENFLSDEEALTTDAPEEELKINSEEEKAFSDDATGVRSCARLRYGSGCGFANSGRRVFVVNARNDRRTRVTVRVTWRNGINRGQFERVYILPAGSQRLLGCTRSGRIPVTDFSFRIVGCELL